MRILCALPAGVRTTAVMSVRKNNGYPIQKYAIPSCNEGKFKSTKDCFMVYGFASNEMSSSSHIASPPHVYLCKCHNEFRDMCPIRVTHVKFHDINIIKCDNYSLRIEVLICEM